MVIRRSFLLFFMTCILLSATHGISTAAGREAADKTRVGTITGRIMVKGGAPLAWGQVLLYDVSNGPPPMPEKYDRTPDITKSIDGEGRYKFDVAPGKYYLGAVKRMSGERFGMPQEGDYSCRSVDEKGNLKVYVVKAGAVTDVGTIAEAVVVKAQDYAKRPITTAIAGVVVDTEGQPVPDASVVAFGNPTMKGMPLFVSERSDKEGKYVLRITPGTYYLRVRNSFTQGPPEPGQIVGYYGDGTPAPVQVKEGEVISGIDFNVILFGGRGPRAGAAPGQ